jgi:hypothetical protein
MLSTPLLWADNVIAQDHIEPPQPFTDAIELSYRSIGSRLCPIDAMGEAIGQLDQFAN